MVCKFSYFIVFLEWKTVLISCKMPAKRKVSSGGDGGGGKKARVDPEPAPRRSSRAPKPKSIFSPSAQPVPPDDPVPWHI